MKKTIILAVAVLTSILQFATAHAQDEMTAMTLSNGHTPLGSARYQGLSGAMGAIGTDFSSVNQNPAGIALFRSGAKASLTATGFITNNKGVWYGSQGENMNNNNFSASEASYIASLGSPSKGVTFGLGISQGGSFERSLKVAATKDSRQGTSLADYTAALLNQLKVPHNKIKEQKQDLYMDPSLPWIGILGWKAGWIEDINGQDGSYQTAFAYDDGSGVFKNYAPNSVSAVSHERGGVKNIDFALGIRLSPKVNLGVMLRGQYIDYEVRTAYQEGFKPNATAEQDYLVLDNYRSISGGGASLAFGVLAEVASGLRLGASVYTPTYYALEQDFRATATGYNDVFRRDKRENKGVEYFAQTPEKAANSFKLSTPWRFGVNAAYVFGHKAILSVDYDFIYSGSARLNGEDDYRAMTMADFSSDNRAISSHFIGQGRVRAGLEYNIVPRLALRAGYRHETPITQSKTFRTPGFSEQLGGTLVHYRLPRGLHAFSLGTGIRLSPMWTLDLAYTGEFSRAEYTPIPTIEDPIVPVPENFMTGLAHIGERMTRHLMSATISIRF